MPTKKKAKQADDQAALSSMLKEYFDIYDALAATRPRLDELKGDILMLAKEMYPDAWKRTVELQEAEMHLTELEDGTVISIPIRRSYDPDKVRATFGEDDPELVESAIETVERVHGAKLTKLWKRADTVKLVMDCLLPGPAPSLKVTRPRKRAS